MRFVPLHVISGYSFLQSGLTMERIEHALKANNYFGVGLADKEVMYGVPEFIKMMERNNKPYIIGEEFTVKGDSLTLFVISEEGYHNLIKLNTIAQKEELNEEILKQHSSGLVSILDTSVGTFKELFVENIDSSFNKYLLNLSSPFKDNFYLGVEVTSKEGVKYANRIRKFANEFTYPCIAFPKVRYEKKDDELILEIVDAIANDNKLKQKTGVGQDYFMSEDDYAKIYSKVEMENTIELVKKSTFNFSIKRGGLLHYPVDDPKETLKQLCFDSLKAKGLEEQKYINRLNHELDVIISMGYADYFLLVQDCVKYAKTHDILVGPGRGSAAGSLVSYLLDITEINPLDYNLQFERFLNPHRKTMPDIDVDFMDTKRDEMIQYMRDRYGHNRVANIIAFQTIGARQALRDIGRVYDYPTHHIDLLSKKITLKDATLRDAYKKIPDFRALVDSDKYFLEIVALASKIEGLPRQTGMHAAGIVLDENPLEESIPVTVLLEDNLICQYEKDYLEEQGLLKMDFLSLSNLTIIYNCVKLINERHGLNLKCDEIPYDEKEIFDLIASNRVMGLFQIETQIMRKAIPVLKPSSFDDIVALLALDRPGPMEYIATYARRKEGKERYGFLSEDLKEILGPTYGIIIYQEQINSIAVKMAGFSLAEADTFRRAISKKNKDVLAKLKQQFLDGAVKKGYSEKVSEEVFRDIMRFAEYGFNKSHSVVYAIIACRMAWLKVHYPLEFYTSLLGSGSATSDSKFSDYVSEMRSLGIRMLPPSINESTNNFVIKDKDILYPLTGIREININTYEKIANERNENGKFKDFFNFVLRMFGQRISDTQIRNLISAGAFDELYPSRESMRMSVLSAMQYAELNHNENGQLTLGIDMVAPPLMNRGEDDPLDNLDKEVAVIGLMLSDNPLSYKQELLKQKGAIKLNEAKDADNCVTAAIVKVKKVINTKKGEQMAYVRVFDDTDEMEITVFPKQYKEYSSLLEKNSIILIKLARRISRSEISYIAEEIKRLEDE